MRKSILHRSGFNLLFLAIIYYSAVQARGQAPKTADKTSQSKRSNETSQPPTTEQKSDFDNRAPSRQQIAGEYISCKFTDEELRTLKAPSIAQTLTEAESERFKQRLLFALSSPSALQEFGPDGVQILVSKFSEEMYQGLTPSKALNRAFETLSSAKPTAATADAIESLKKQLLVIGEVRPGAATDSMTKFLGAAVESGRHASFVQIKEDLVLPLASFVRRSPDQKETNLPALIKFLQTTNSSAKTEIADSAREALAILERPDDIGCAMSILDYTETEHAYGFMIAREYIAVQVVIRNLNATQPFVLHDVEFGVDTDADGKSGRFSSGRDKVIVRALSSTQQDFSPRNIVIHSAYGVGSLLSSMTPFFGMALINASAVYTGAFVPSLDKYFKDQSGNQLNLLNDTGFSSSLNAQTVVPQSGSAVVVIFIPERQYDQSWWTQRCVEQVYLGHQEISSTSTPAGSEEKAKESPDSSTLRPVVKRALELCASDDYDRKFGGRKDGKHLLITPHQDTGKTTSQLIFRPARKLHYRNWSGISLSIFRELSDTVIAGTHIVEERDLEPEIDQVICETDADGNLVFPTAGDQVSCTVSGKNLYRFSKLRLRNAKNVLDTNVVDGSVLVSGDSQSAKVTFKTADLRSLSESAYEVFGVTSSGIEHKTSQLIRLKLIPHLSNVDPKEINCQQPSEENLQITGFHLDMVNELRLSSREDSKVSVDLTIDRPISTSTKLFVKIPKDLPKQAKAEGYEIMIENGQDATSSENTQLSCAVIEAKTDTTSATSSSSKAPKKRK